MLPRAFDQRLAVLARNALADTIEVPFEQLAITKKHARPLDRRRIAPARNAAAAACTASSTSAALPTGHSAMTSPVDGLKMGVVGRLELRLHSRQ
jgi:hypothetical protein